MREYATLECTECKREYYRTMVDPKAPKKLELKKHCPFCRKHTTHKQKKK